MYEILGPILGPVLNAVIVLGGGFIALRSMVASISTGLDSLDKRVTDVTSNINNRLTDLESDIRMLNQVVVSNARMEERLSSLRSEVTSFMTSQTNAHAEWRAWVRKSFERMETELKSVELRSVAAKISHAIDD